MYSDMSNLITASSLSKSSYASAFTSAVLPTPVGPTNINDGGRLDEVMFARRLSIALDSLFIA